MLQRFQSRHARVRVPRRARARASARRSDNERALLVRGQTLAACQGPATTAAGSKEKKWIWSYFIKLVFAAQSARVARFESVAWRQKLRVAKSARAASSVAHTAPPNTQSAKPIAQMHAIAHQVAPLRAGHRCPRAGRSNRAPTPRRALLDAAGGGEQEQELFVFGLGYTSLALIRHLGASGW